MRTIRTHHEIGNIKLDVMFSIEDTNTEPTNTIFAIPERKITPQTIADIRAKFGQKRLLGATGVNERTLRYWIGGNRTPNEFNMKILELFAREIERKN